MQHNLPTHATQPADSCNLICWFVWRQLPTQDFSRRFISFWKNFTKRRRRRSHARFVVGLLILLVLLILLIYKERGLIINELRGVKLNGSSTVLSRLFNERFIFNEKTAPCRPLFYGKKRGQNIMKYVTRKTSQWTKRKMVYLSHKHAYTYYNKVMRFC